MHWDNLSVPEQTIANEIYKMQNVVISPHRGGFIEGVLPHLRGAIKNLQKVAEGRVEDIEGVINLVEILMLDSKVVSLRTLEEEDLEARVKWFNDPETNQFWFQIIDEFIKDEALVSK